MNDTTVIDIAIQAMMITAKLAAPILIVSLAIGVAVSLLQSVTQVQEYTLTFVPKLAGIAVVIVVAGSWMLHQLVAFTQDLFARVPTLVR
ncbi:MAG: export protein FliQ family 3 [Acidimicrobiales bacterium]|jgi:flagellar biosynthetic protein FliQ|nr:export protein FliQ family 3 [Acidimicrobiales bacterium]